MPPSETQKGLKMAGSRSAPTVNGTPTKTTLSMSFFDADEGDTTVTFQIANGTTDADIEALAAAAQAGSNASLYDVSIQESYSGIGLASNAAADDYVSVKDAVRFSNKNLATNAYIRAYLPAPLGNMVYNKTVVTSDTEYAAWRDAVIAVLPSGYAALNAGFVQNVQRDKGVSPGV